MSKHIILAAALLVGTAHGEEIDLARTNDGENRYTINDQTIRWATHDGQLVVGAQGLGYNVNAPRPLKINYVVTGCANGFGTIFLKVETQELAKYLWRRGGNLVYDIVATNLCMTPNDKKGS